MRLHRSAARSLLVSALLLASLCCWQLAVASAGVRAFSARTGAEDTAFVTLGLVKGPRALIPDGRHGLYVVGHLTVGGQARSIVHLLPDGTVDAVFRASVAPSAVLFGAARGDELVLAGRFVQIDGGRRHDIAVLDARTGRLSSWTPTAPRGGVRGVAFAGARLVANVGRQLVAWSDGAPDPVWSRALPASNADIVSWRGSIVTADGGELYSVDPATGATRTLSRDFSYGQLENVGGRLYYSVEGMYQLYGTHATPTCGQQFGSTAPAALAGTATRLYVASGPVDADSPAPPQHIFACTHQDAEAPAFTPPSLPMPEQFVEGMALVGTHLLVFTGTFS